MMILDANSTRVHYGFRSNAFLLVLSTIIVSFMSFYTIAEDALLQRPDMANHVCTMALSAR